MCGLGSGACRVVRREQALALGVVDCADREGGAVLLREEANCRARGRRHRGRGRGEGQA
jgi:hypothetical protein